VVLPDPNLSGSVFATIVKNAVKTVLPRILQESLATTYPKSVINTIVEKLSNQADITSSRFHASIVNLVQTTLPDVLRDLPSLNNALEEIAVAAFNREFDAAVSNAKDALKEKSQENQEALAYYCYDKTNEFERELDAGTEEAAAEIRKAVDCVKQCADDELDDFRERLDNLNGATTLRQDIEDLAKTKTKLAKELKRSGRMKKKLNKERLKLGEKRRKSEEERAKSEKERRKLKHAIGKIRKARQETNKINLKGSKTPEVGFQFRRPVATTKGSGE
jgi:chromosome segregation ATPase